MCRHDCSRYGNKTFPWKPVGLCNSIRSLVVLFSAHSLKHFAQLTPDQHLQFYYLWLFTASQSPRSFYHSFSLWPHFKIELSLETSGKFHYRAGKQSAISTAKTSKRLNSMEKIRKLQLESPVKPLQMSQISLQDFPASTMASWHFLNGSQIHLSPPAGSDEGQSPSERAKTRSRTPWQSLNRTAGDQRESVVAESSQTKQKKRSVYKCI